MSIEGKIVASINFEHGTCFKTKDLMEWSTSDVKNHDGEVVYRSKEYGINAAFKVKQKKGSTK